MAEGKMKKKIEKKIKTEKGGGGKGQGLVEAWMNLLGRGMDEGSDLLG
jgi:hypothetical protein